LVTYDFGSGECESIGLRTRGLVMCPDRACHERGQRGNLFYPQRRMKKLRVLAEARQEFADALHHAKRKPGYWLEQIP